MEDGGGEIWGHRQDEGWPCWSSSTQLLCIWNHVGHIARLHVKSQKGISFAFSRLICHFVALGSHK